MVDIHHHLLHSLDDGPPDLETSFAMARMAAADGITHVVCTPHASGAFEYDPALIAARLTELRAALDAANVPLTLGVGCDFHISYDNIQDALRDPARFSINGRGTLLIELPDHVLPPSLAETFYELQLAGLTLILTHPERNPVLQRDPRRMEDWLRSGVLVQVTAGSVMGRMGKQAERMAHKLLADRWVHFLATDAHNLDGRAPRLREACDWVAAHHGTEYAALLCTGNPTAAFNGDPLPPQPAPRGLFAREEEDDDAPAADALATALPPVKHHPRNGLCLSPSS